jgi:hypothetical protein
MRRGHHQQSIHVSAFELSHLCQFTNHPESMILKFPELMGGTVQGLNDAGVENFQGAIDLYLSRECGQNTGDALRPGESTARLEFQRLTLPAAEIPAFSSLRETLTSCLERWGTKKKDREFFETAVSIASQAQIDVLKISDYGTTGLTGSDTDEAGRWFALVKSQGVSNKEDTAGGSFGIGKSSPFAASRFRTVFYGTRTVAGEEALQGVSRLVTHKNRQGRETQGVGFIGDYDPEGGHGGSPLFRAVRDPVRIPGFFRRAEPGTDIWVIGYRSGREWSDDLVRSILTNFWPAIHRGNIDFAVGGMAIDRNNLEELIRKYAGSEDFDTDKYYAALSSKPIEKQLNYVGSCQLYLTSAHPDLPKKICMARHSGMRIFDYQPRACRVPFSGLFICTDDEGNKLLRRLEPPKHDTWDPKRTEDGSGKRALDEIKKWIRDEVKKLNPLFGGKSFNESELAKYLPDTLPDDASNLPRDSDTSGREESLEPRPRPGDVRPPPVKAKPAVSVIGGEDEGGFGSEEQSGHPEHKDGRSRNRPGSGGGNANDQQPPPIDVRSFSTTPNEYTMILRSRSNFSGRIKVRAVGEDGPAEPVVLRHAASGEEPASTLRVSGDTIEGISISADVPLRLTVALSAPARRSLSAVAVP